MKKQFTKIKIAAENLSRSNKSDCKDFELEIIEKQVEKYRDTIEKILRKLPAVSNISSVSSNTNSILNNGNSNSSNSSSFNSEEYEKRVKKNAHYKIGVALEESSKELPKDMPLQDVLSDCGELERALAECIVEAEVETETRVARRLKNILDKEIQDISTLKRNVSRTIQEYTSLKRSYEAAIRLDEPPAKIKHIKSQQEECEIKLEKERDMWAAQMFELIAKEDEIISCLRDYVLNQRYYHERALHRVNLSLASIQDTIQSTKKLRFGTSLKEHLTSTNRNISYIIELCACCLIEHGLCEEGLLRVGCASTKLRRMKHALEAQYIKTPLPVEYQDPHVIGSILKLYLRELPEPILTYGCYNNFIRVAELNSEAERKIEIKKILGKLPAENYANLRYLTRFLWLVTQNVEHNKMSSQNLAIVMAPNMLWPRVDKSTGIAGSDYLGQVNSSSAANIIVELLISQWDYFFEGGVDFFITLQKNKLFVERKTKSNSSNEHLDRQENDVQESPRYGTIRRQKANAPSPPTKVGDFTHAHTNGEQQRAHIKDLFAQQMQQSSSVDKPEKPPVPKLPQICVPPPLPAEISMPPPQASITSVNKPVPMTRTQFFGLDNLPSPTADRKSNDSVNSLTFKPDLPQKPKIPKRPMVLGLGNNTNMNTNCTNLNNNSNNNNNNNNKNENEEPSATLSTITAQTQIDSAGGNIRCATEKFVDKLRQENCDNNIDDAGTAAKANSENNHNQQMLAAEQNNTIASTVTGATTTTTTTTTITIAPLAQQTPTTPISPNMLNTPKRPTVPAPPPPTSNKKSSD